MPETINKRDESMQSKKSLLTLKEMCGELRITESTAYYWRQIGKGPKGARLGKNIVYRAADVQAYIEEQFS